MGAWGAPRLEPRGQNGSSDLLWGVEFTGAHTNRGAVYSHLGFMDEDTKEQRRYVVSARATVGKKDEMGVGPHLWPLFTPPSPDV